MHSAGVPDVRVGTGPGLRDKECEICREEIKDEDSSISHLSCANTFHRGCLDDWTKSNYALVRSTSCPKCRALLYGPGPTLFGISSNQVAPVSPSAPLTGPTLTTSEIEMYDYIMQPTESSTNDFPTPALIHRLQTRRSEFSAWIADYFLRQRQAQNFSNNQIVSRIMDCYLIFDRALPRDQVPLAKGLRVIHDEIRPGEAATDLEIVNDRGDRRPRPSVVEFYMEQPDEACAWLRRRTAATQTELRLDLGLMREFRWRFEKNVQREIERRRSASKIVQEECSISEAIASESTEAANAIAYWP